MPEFVDGGLCNKGFDSCCELNTKETIAGTNQSVSIFFKE